MLELAKKDTFWSLDSNRKVYVHVLLGHALYKRIFFLNNRPFLGNVSDLGIRIRFGPQIPIQLRNANRDSNTASLKTNAGSGNLRSGEFCKDYFYVKFIFTEIALNEPKFYFLREII